MKFICIPKRLYEAAKRCQTVTNCPLKEVAIESGDDGELSVYNNSGEAFAGQGFDGGGIDRGKCAVPLSNLAPLEFATDEAEFVVDEKMRVGGLTIALSSTSIETYMPIEYSGVFHTIPKEALGVTWTTGRDWGKTGRGGDVAIFFQGNLVGCNNNGEIISIYELDNVVIDGEAAISPATAMFPGEMMFDSGHVFIKDGDFLARLQTSVIPSPIKFIHDRMKNFTPVASISVTPDFEGSLRQMASFGSETYGVIAYNGGSTLFFENNPRESGHMAERRKAVVTGEPFVFCFHVQKLLSSISKTPLARVEIKRNVSGDQSQDVAMVVSGDGKMKSIIVMAVPFWDLKYKKETNND